MRSGPFPTPPRFMLPCLFARGSRSWLLRRTFLIGALLTTLVGCGSDEADVSEDSAAYGGWSSTTEPVCDEQRGAIAAIEADGFVRTGETTTPVAVGGTAKSGYTYKGAPAYRYEHADGRVQYAVCHGRVGPEYPVKGTTLHLTGTWTGLSYDGSGQKTNLPSQPGALDLTLSDFEHYQTEIDVVMSARMETPLRRVEERWVSCQSLYGKLNGNVDPSRKCLDRVRVPVVFDDPDQYAKYENSDHGFSILSPYSSDPDALSLTMSVTPKPGGGFLVNGTAYLANAGERWTFTAP